MKISFVLPVYNCSSFLADTIESLINQDYEDRQILVVDDCSDDLIEPLRIYYKEEFGDIINWCTLPDRRGAAHARNKANEFADGDIIAVCDAGDISLPNRARAIVKYFEETGKDLCYSHVQVNAAYGDMMQIQEAKKWNGEKKPPISHPTVAYRKHVAEKCKYHEGCLDTDFYEFFLIDCWKAGFKFGMIDKVLYVKRDLSKLDSYRDVQKAKDLKFEKYKEYGMEMAREAV